MYLFSNISILSLSNFVDVNVYAGTYSEDAYAHAYVRYNTNLRLIQSFTKLLNSIITKYMNKRNMIESNYEFTTISKSIENLKMLTSLDVASLFINII